MQNIFGILESYSFTLHRSHWWHLKFYLKSPSTHCVPNIHHIHFFAFPLLQVRDPPTWGRWRGRGGDTWLRWWWARGSQRLYKRYVMNAIISQHSALIRNLIKLKGTTKLTAQGGLVCLKNSKYILFKILANRTWNGCTSSCCPSKPDLAIWQARPAGATTALPCPLF